MFESESTVIGDGHREIAIVNSPAENETLAKSFMEHPPAELDALLVSGELRWQQLEQDWIEKEKTRAESMDGVIIPPSLKVKADKLIELIKKRTGGGALICGRPGMGKTLFSLYLARRLQALRSPDDAELKEDENFWFLSVSVGQTMADLLTKPDGTPGPLQAAAEKGGTVVVDEAEKMAIKGLIAFGQGAEQLLEPVEINGKMFFRSADGLVSIDDIHDNFLVIAVVNDEEKVPDNIRRRFQRFDLELTPEDLIFQARMLFSNEDGSSLLQDRTVDENRLCSFLLWWTSLARDTNQAFSINVLTKLRSLMIEDQHSFDQAIGLLLTQSYPEVLRAYQIYTSKTQRQVGNGSRKVRLFGGKSSTASHEAQLSLSELNWQANRYVLKTMPPQDSLWTVDTTYPVVEGDNGGRSPEIDNVKNFLNVQVQGRQLVISVEDGIIPATGIHKSDGRIAKITLDDDLVPYNRVLAHSPLSRIVLLSKPVANKSDSSQKNRGQEIVVIDTTTGEKMPAVEAKKVRGSLEGSQDIRGKILEARFFDEQNGFLVVEEGENIVLKIFTVKDTVVNRGSILEPELRVTVSRLLSSEKIEGIKINGQVVSLKDEKGKTICFYVNRGDALNPINELGDENQGLKFVQTPLGATYVINKTTGEAQWLQA